MKGTSLVAFSLLLASSLFADTGQRIIPAGSLISCTVGEAKISSKNTAVGDPVLCQVGFSELYGRSVLPYNSFLEGRFDDYKDPGHFVGKGWMELKFNRMFIEPDTIIPINARVVDVPGYRVDTHGRIMGKGHAVRDTVAWTIPILWPIDMLNLPRRGPRPTLKEETRITLKVMNDLVVPATSGPQQDPYGLMHRSPNAYAPEPPPPVQEQQPPPQSAYVPESQPAPPPPVYYAPMVVAMTPPVIGYAPSAYAPWMYTPVIIRPSRPVIAYAPVTGYYVPRGYAGAYAYGAPAVTYYAPGVSAYAPPRAAYHTPWTYSPGNSYVPRAPAPPVQTTYGNTYGNIRRVSYTRPVSQPQGYGSTVGIGTVYGVY